MAADFRSWMTRAGLFLVAMQLAGLLPAAAFHFEPNRGQTAATVRYLVHGRDTSVFFTDRETVIQRDGKGASAVFGWTIPAAGATRFSNRTTRPRNGRAICAGAIAPAGSRMHRPTSVW